LSFYSRKNLFHPDVVMGLAGFSLGVIYVPTIIQAITQTSPLYPALMIGYGMWHSLVGNQTSLKLYQYAGAAAILLAVILETSDFIWALPRWLLIGGLGLGLISLAVGLLLRRNDKK